MASGGYIKITRAVFDHPSFAREAFTEREAWLWLIAEAAWRERAADINGEAVPLGRGELAHSERWLARRWRWSRSRVQRFRDRLERDGMIESVPGKVGTVVRIVNYDRYQSGPPSGPPQREKSGHANPCDNSENGDARATITGASGPPSGPELEVITQEGKEYMRNATQDGGKVISLNAKRTGNEPDATKAKLPAGGKFQGVDDWFEQAFWPAYPLKRGKKEARRAFAKAVASGVDPADMLAGAERYAVECRRRGTPPDKIKYAQGWISGERWTDEPLDSGSTGSLAEIAMQQAVAAGGRTGGTGDDW
ncbi:hypothetical protein [Microbaculum marinisediminis]|uniref:Helix-turn-helix domain-containing protein n=1 Tax=Microbaculum marinisediminis TaxID=2931392 RepID=A0AAW5QVD3_9HYPH|nr:hypothetical protein [Microbaculum sp. A6E488]MCT8970874.1 hypothetical protein [Microbaculum sp. A6E488]